MGTYHPETALKLATVKITELIGSDINDPPDLSELLNFMTRVCEVFTCIQDSG